MSDTNERSVASAGSTGHVPDASRLPAAVTGWMPIPADMVFHDGEQWLMAVAVKHRHTPGWSYELSVVTMCCDEDYFAIQCDGEPWGWSIEDVDFGVRLSR
jgi:hypothetical protein